MASTCTGTQANLGATYTEGLLTAAGTCTAVASAPATGSYIQEVPTTTAQNTIAPTTNSVVALTVKGTTGTAADVLDVYNAAATPTLQDYFDHNGSLNVSQAIQPTANNSINLGVVGAAFANVYSTNFDTGTTTTTLGIGTTNATAITLGRSGASLAIASSGLNVSTAGAISGVTTLGASGLISDTAATSGLTLSGAPAPGTGITSLVDLGNAIASGNTSANGGTYLGINEPSSGAGSAADFLNFENNGASKLEVTSSGALTEAGQLTVSGGGIAVTGNSTISGTLGSLTGLTLASGNISGATTITGGTIDATTALQANGTPGVASTCTGTQANLGATYTEGLLTAAGTCTAVASAPATGSYIQEVPTTTAQNTIAPTTNSVVALTVKGTTGTAADVLDVYNAAATPTLQDYFDHNGSLNVKQYNRLPINSKHRYLCDWYVYRQPNRSEWFVA